MPYEEFENGSDKDNEGSGVVRELRRLQGDYGKVIASHTEKICHLISKAAEMAEKLREDGKETVFFYEQSFWENRYDLNRKRLRQHCMQFLVGAPSSRSLRYPTACSYNDAVSILYEKGYSVQDLYEELTARGGPYAVVRAEGGKLLPTNGKSRDHDTEENPLNKNNEEDDGDPNDDIAPHDAADHEPEDLPTFGQRRSTGLGNAIRHRREPIFKETEHIAISGNAFNNRCRAMQVGEQIWALLERDEDEGEIFQIRAIKTKPADPE